MTQRAPGRELLFLESADYLYFLQKLKEATRKFDFEIFCFSLLPNHLHLLLRINRNNLSAAMKNIFERYAKYFNGKYKRKGHVFCGRYRASLCNDENYFLAASLYIHRNAYQARLYSSVEDYRWSSVRLYTRPIKKSFVNYTCILSILDAELKKARRKYRDILRDSIKIKSKREVDRNVLRDC